MKVPDFSVQSGRQDLNLRPHGPQPCALAKLSHAPNSKYYYNKRNEKCNSFYCIMRVYFYLLLYNEEAVRKISGMDEVKTGGMRDEKDHQL